MNIDDLMGSIGGALASVLQGAVDRLSEGFLSFLFSPYGIFMGALVIGGALWARR